MYLFSRQFLEELPQRFTGPGRLRFILQPMVAIVLGIRGGLADVKAGNPPYLFGLLFGAERRGELLRSGVAAIRNLLALGIIMDIVFHNWPFMTTRCSSGRRPPVGRADAYLLPCCATLQSTDGRLSRGTSASDGYKETAPTLYRFNVTDKSQSHYGNGISVDCGLETGFEESTDDVLERDFSGGCPKVR